MKIGIFPGSFDPITKGHVDIIERALKIFDRVVIAIGKNVNKTSLFSLKEKKQMILLATNDNQKIKIVEYDSLTAELMKELGAVAIIRGVRNGGDAEYENNLFFIGNKLNENYEVVYFPTRQEYLHVSSSFVREILKFGGDISSLVPESIAETVIKKAGK